MKLQRRLWSIACLLTLLGLLVPGRAQAEGSTDNAQAPTLVGLGKKNPGVRAKIAAAEDVIVTNNYLRLGGDASGNFGLKTADGRVLTYRGETYGGRASISIDGSSSSYPSFDFLEEGGGGSSRIRSRMGTA